MSVPPGIADPLPADYPVVSLGTGILAVEWETYVGGLTADAGASASNINIFFGFAKLGTAGDYQSSPITIRYFPSTDTFQVVSPISAIGPAIAAPVSGKLVVGLYVDLSDQSFGMTINGTDYPNAGTLPEPIQNKFIFSAIDPSDTRPSGDDNQVVTIAVKPAKGMWTQPFPAGAIDLDAAT